MVGKQPYSGGEDRRREPRYRLDDSVVMVDTDSGAELGLVLDLHHHGFMLMCPSGVEQGRSFGLKMFVAPAILTVAQT